MASDQVFIKLGKMIVNFFLNLESIFLVVILNGSIESCSKLLNCEIFFVSQVVFYGKQK